MNIIFIIGIFAFLDLAGRVAALAVLMHNNRVSHLSYRTWVLLCAFLNFAWVAYFIIGKKQTDE